VAFFAVVALGAGVGSFLGAERKLSVLADQAAMLSRPDPLSTSMVVDAGDLATALEGLQDVFPVESQAETTSSPLRDIRIPLGFPADADADMGNSFILPEPLGSASRRTFEFNHPGLSQGIIIQRRIETRSSADLSRAGQSRQQTPQGQYEISPLAPGTRVVVRVIGRIPALSKDDRID
jgi:hypothetical protein